MIQLSARNIVVFFVVFAAVMLLFLDMFIITTSTDGIINGLQREAFVMEASPIRPGDVADREWMKVVEDTFLRMMSRFPTLVEKKAILRYLASEKYACGKSVDDPERIVEDLLRNSNDYHKGETADYLIGEHDADARRSASASVRNFRRDYITQNGGNGHLSEKDTRMALVYHTFSSMLNRIPSAAEMDVMMRYASSPGELRRAMTNISSYERASLHGQRRDSITEKGSDTVAPATPLPGQESRQRDQREISRVYEAVHGTPPPLYVTDLLIDTYVNECSRDAKALRARLQSTMEKAWRGRCEASAVKKDVRQSKDNHRCHRHPEALITPNSYTCIPLPHAPVDHVENLGCFIVSDEEFRMENTENNAIDPISDRLDGWGKLTLQRHALIAGI